MDRPDRYDHITDLNWLPPAGAAVPAVPPGPAGPAGPAGASSSGGSTNPAASGGSTNKSSRPPTSWTLFMQTKLHEMRKENPNISFGEVSKEAARQWKEASDEDKSFYQRLAKQVADIDM